MEYFWKAVGLVLLSVLLGLALAKTDFALLLSMTTCCIAAGTVAVYLKPVIAFIREISEMGQLKNEMLEILIKAVGISLVSEMAARICCDAGNGSLGKTLQILGSAVVLYLSIPIFQAFLELLQELLGII